MRRIGLHTLRGATRRKGTRACAPFVEALDPLVARRPELADALSDSAQVALSRLPSVRRLGGGELRRPSRLLGRCPLGCSAAGDAGVVIAIVTARGNEATAALVHHLAPARPETHARDRCHARWALPRPVSLVRSSLVETALRWGRWVRSTVPP
jgi:hypothetical protein